MGGTLITVVGWGLLLGGGALMALGLLGLLGISEIGRLHHVAMLAIGIPTMTFGGLVLWMQRFGIDD